MIDLIKQPNGKYCYVNYLGQAEFLNLTEQDVINMYIEKAKEDMDKAEHYGKIIEKIEFSCKINITRNISDEDLKSMGFDKTFDELVKFIPSDPIHQVYASCDFSTYGISPSYGKRAQDGIEYTTTKCSCSKF